MNVECVYMVKFEDGLEHEENMGYVDAYGRMMR